MTIVLAALFLVLNTILESIIKNRIITELDIISKDSDYTLGIKNVDINIFGGNASITGFYAKPKASLFSAYVKGEATRV